MAHTITKIGRMEQIGSRKKILAKLNITSIGSGGETPTAPSGFRAIDAILPQGLTDEGYALKWNPNTGKVQAFQPNNGGLVTDVFPDIKGGENANQATGSNTTDPVNGAFVHALAGIVTTVVNTGITNPDYPRSLVVQVRSAGGGALPADMGTVTIIGTDQFDAAQTEVIALSALNGVTLSAGGEVWVVGTKVFKTVTSYQFSVDVAATLADANASIGLGTVIGLRTKLGAAGDVKVVQKNTAKVGSGTYTASATTHSVKMGANLADDDEVYIQYDAKASGKVDLEATSTTDVGEAIVYVVGT